MFKKSKDDDHTERALHEAVPERVKTIRIKDVVLINKEGASVYRFKDDSFLVYYQDRPDNYVIFDDPENGWPMLLHYNASLRMYTQVGIKFQYSHVILFVDI